MDEGASGDRAWGGEQRGTLGKERAMDGGRMRWRERGGGFSKWASLLMEAI